MAKRRGSGLHRNGLRKRRRVVPMARRRRRRARRSAARSRITTMRVPRIIFGTADRCSVKLLYTSSIITNTITSGATRQQTFRGNSLFDPDQTGTGNQPRYHDQWSAFFGKYYVTGCTAIVRFVNETISTAGRVLITTSTLATPPAALDAAEKTDKRVGWFSTNKSILAMRVSRSTSSFGDPDMSFEDNSALNAANPATPWFYHIAMQNLSGVTITFTLIVEMQFSVLYSNRLHPGQS